MRSLLLLLTLLLVLLVSNAEAESVTLSWGAPTQNTDGTPLIDLAGYKLYYGLTQGGPYPSEVDITDETVTSYVLDGLSTGTYFFVATAYNAAGIESDYSGEATKTVQSTPNPPGNLVVTGDLTAWSISISRDAFVLYPVGTVADGTPCDTEQTAYGLHRVDVATVSFAGGADATVAFAQCGSG